MANQQKDSDSPNQSITTGLHERSTRGTMDGAVDVGDLPRGTKSVKVKKPQFSESFPEAAIREGAEE